MKAPDTSPIADTSELDKAAKKAVDYLYNIDGEVSPELYRAIDRLRQLVNEEFVGKNKSVSSQLIYDIISPVVDTETAKARYDGIETVLLKLKQAPPVDWIDAQSWIDSEYERLQKLKGEEK